MLLSLDSELQSFNKRTLTRMRLSARLHRAHAQLGRQPERAQEVLRHRKPLPPQPTIPLPLARHQRLQQ
jgi:hypothetical protein